MMIKTHQTIVTEVMLKERDLKQLVEDSLGAHHCRTHVTVRLPEGENLSGATIPFDDLSVTITWHD